MNYELAKELKDAGFQLTEIAGERNDPYDPAPDAEQMSRVGFVGGGVVPFVVFIGDTTFYKLPTLSELIEACHIRQVIKPGTSVLHVNQKDFETHEVMPAVAMVQVGEWVAWDDGYAVDARSEGAQYGSTPEEAVARLWLALNKK